MTEKSEVGLARDRTCGHSKSLDSQSSFFVSWRDNKGVITPKSNPIDDNSNISSNMLQKNFKPLGHYTCMQCGTSHLQTVQENILSHIRKFTVSDSHKISVAIFTSTPYINKWQMSLCNNSSENKSY